jgi:hypothetical protein
MNKQTKNYWQIKREQELAQGWIVVASDMDGITGYEVVHALDAPDVRRGNYWLGCVQKLTRDRKEAQDFADQLNAKNEPAPENPRRGLRF